MAVVEPLLESVIRRDRLVLVAGLIAVVALAWGWLLLGAGMSMDAFEMTARPYAVDGMVMKPAVWTLPYAALMFTMWWVMMLAMMLPSAAPMLLLFARVNRKDKVAGGSLVPTGFFAVGYLIAWGVFSAVAVGLQWSLEHAELLSPMMVTTSHWLGAGILIAAGLWQLTPIKTMCLRHCRSPLGFLITSWQTGRWGALRMGLEHGVFCLGCCWFLMTLLFFGGVMNLYWIVGLAAFVLLEKTIPIGHWLGRVAGILLVVWGVVLGASTI